MLRARLIAGVPADLVGSLTGLTEGRFPVAARARYADDLAEQEALRRVKRGQNAANVIESADSRRGIEIYSQGGRPGRRRQRRRRQEDRPLGGARPLPRAPGRVRQPLHLRPPRQGRRALPGADRGCEPTRSAPRRPSPPTTPRPRRPGPPRPAARPTRPRAPARHEALGARPSQASVPVKERLFAHPDLPAARGAGGLEQQLDAQGAPRGRLRDLPQLLLAPVRPRRLATSGCASSRRARA